MIIALFWFSLLALMYVYAGYPLVAWLRGHLRPKLCNRGAIEPMVTVVVIAYNEAARIADRIENLLASEYPARKLEIIIASDGSTDQTVEHALKYQARGVTVKGFRERRGKAAVLNDVIPTAKGRIVVLADARQSFEPAAIRWLVANFADPSVGAVSGELMAPGFYWQYEKFIRANESWFGSTVGATGAIYAIRRDLFDSIPEDTILDDVLIPVRIVRKGYRALFEAQARAYDVIASHRAEFSRKARTIAGTFQLFARESWLLQPRRSKLWFQAWSHKALRLALPLLHAAFFVANIALSGFWFYTWMLAGQLLFYGAAAAGGMTSGARWRPALLTVPFAICLMIWATIVGFVRFVTGTQRATWERALGTDAVAR